MTAPARILVVDDEQKARSALADILEDEGYETALAKDGIEALDALERFDPDVVLTDLKMPRMDGLELLRRSTPTERHATFVVMTAFGSIDTAVEAIKLGAEHYLIKPLKIDALLSIVERALARTKLSREAARLRAALEDRAGFDDIVGDHPSMQRLLKRLAQAAPSRATVLIAGESGTGKELVASAIHHRSPRREKPFVRLNCAALAESLLESELFGHEKGAFTGAMQTRRGRFEQADGGTLFLDEVSEIPLATQVKLLRFLQERELERVGGNETISVDVRVVAATNKDLRQEIEAGRFREDLYYRLDVVRLEIPPLRARKTDIPALAAHFLARFGEENGREVEGFTDEAMGQLLRYPWPGNVRELENAVERAVVMSEGPRIGGAELPHGSPAVEGELRSMFPGLTLAELERIAIEETLAALDGSTARAAEALGVSQRTIQYRIKQWQAETDAEEE